MFSSEEARGILDKNCRKKTGKVASTYGVKSQPRPHSEVSRLDFWTSGGDARKITERTSAYLEAYKEIAESSIIPAQGIKLQKGYMWLDKGVIRFALSKGLIVFDKDKIEFQIKDFKIF